MRLYLSSYRFGAAADRLIELVEPGARVAALEGVGMVWAVGAPRAISSRSVSTTM